MNCKCCGQAIKENIIQVIPTKTLEWGNASEKEMTWDEAKDWCKKQGEGFRLPTNIELLQAFEGKIDGFQSNYYWSSTEFGTYFAWNVSFSNGGSANFNKNLANYVRAVKEQ